MLLSLNKSGPVADLGAPAQQDVALHAHDLERNG